MTTINTANLEIQISKNINSANTQQLLSYAKSAIRLQNGLIGHANTFCELPEPQMVPKTLYFIDDTGQTFQSNGTNWTSAFSLSNNETGSSCGIVFIGECCTPFTPSATGVQDQNNTCYLTPYTGRDVRCVHSADPTNHQNSLWLLKCDSTLWAVGTMLQWSSSIASTFSCSIPVQERTQSKWMSVAASRMTTAGVKTDGTIWTWGSYYYGALGQNGQENLGPGNGYGQLSSPKQEVTSSSSWKCVTGGYGGFSAMKSDGSIWGWGRNHCGGLGDGTTTNRSSPVREVTSSTNWCHLSVGYLNRVAIKTNGTLWGWGTGGSGILGLNDPTTQCARCSPTQETTGSSNWKMAWIGGRDLNTQTTAALKTDGTLWLWGKGGEGALGLGCVTSAFSSPVQEKTLSTDWCFARGHGYATFAVKTNGSLWFAGQNDNCCGRVLYGNNLNLNHCLFFHGDGMNPNNWVCVEPLNKDRIFVGFRR